jgi:glycosyltransferase involved in cell wall biosynthesis
MTLPSAICTVVIPCYNGQRELAAAVDSVRAQVFNDYHLVLVDDASTDGTLDLMRRLAENQPGTTVVALPQNSGRSAARNRGADATQGPLLAFLDHDDTYHPHFLRDTALALQSNPLLDRVKVSPNVSIELDPLRYEAVANSLTTTAVVRRAAFNFMGGWPDSPLFRTHVHAGEDVAFEQLFGCCFTTARLPQKLYNYMHRPDNALARFLARSIVENGKLRSTHEASEEDKQLFREIERFRGLLAQRVRAIGLQLGATGRQPL